MRHNYHKLLNYVLVIMLALSPWRVAFAGQMKACDMKVKTTSVASMVKQNSTMSEHCRHMSMTDQLPPDTAGKTMAGKTVSSKFCCCNDHAACAGHCSAMTISMIINTAEYTPVLHAVEIISVAGTALLIRQLTPPSRPPLSLYS